MLDTWCGGGKDWDMPLSAFVHPWFAASAVVLGAVPILIHLLNRRRFRRVVWAAMGFLAAAQRRSARRVRIEQLILLAVRVLVMVLIALAVARPLLGPGAAAGMGHVSCHRVIVLDDSYSMGMMSADGQRAFDRGLAAAQTLVGSFGPDDGVSLILASRPARPLVERPSYDRRAVARILSECTMSDAPTDLAGALDLAAGALAESDVPPGNRVVYVITDGTAVAWTGGTEDQTRTVRAVAQRLTSQAGLFVVDVGQDLRDNLAVTSLKLAEPTLSAEWPATLLAEVANHGKQEVRGLRLQVAVDDEVVRTEQVEPVAPDGSRTVRFRRQQGGPGSHLVRVRLIGERPDALPLDDTRWLATAVRKEVQVLLVDGRPGPDRFAGQTGYLATALAPKTTPIDPVLVTPRVIMPGELAIEPLSDYAAVALCNVRQLGAQTWQWLARYVHQGGGLMVFVGDQINLDDYAQFGFADGTGVLPARVVGLAGSQDDREAFVRIRSEGLVHPSVADLAGQPRSGLFLARFYQHARLQVPTDLDGVGVVLSFENGDCAVAARTVGHGRSVIIGFPPTMDWTNLPAKGDFVSLALGLLTWVIGDPALNRNVLVGEPIAEPLTGRDASLPVSVVGPDDRTVRVVVTSQPASDRSIARYEATRRAGGYTLKVGPRAIDFSVNLDPREGDLRPMNPRALRKELGIDFEYVRNVDETAASAKSGAQREIGGGLLWVVLGLLAVEMLLAMWFGHHRE